MSTRSRGFPRPPGRGRLARLVSLACGLPLAGGCYTYAQIPAQPAPVGENVRVVVARAAAPELLAVSENVELVPRIRGRVEGTEGGSVLLRVPVRTEMSTGTSLPDIGQVVRIPSDEILSMELQSFSPQRTSLLVAGTAAAAAFVIYLIIDAGRGDDGIDQPDPDVLFNLLRIPVG